MGRLISNIVYGNQKFSANGKARFSKNPTLANMTLIAIRERIGKLKGSWPNPQKPKKKTLSHTSPAGYVEL
jgi:hypothetical protein